VYVPLGAVAGTVGHAVEVRPVVGAAAGLALAAALVVAAWIPAASTESLVPVARLVRRAGANGPIARALSAARRLLASGVVFPLGAAGFVLGALPCMLPAWVLGLAAGAGSALHGAALMALLLAMNTGPLALAAALLPGATRGRLAVLLPRSAMSLSALWLTLGALASLHLLPHGRAVVFGRTITFW
jgi:sulfite exporter TauE/SafE